MGPNQVISASDSGLDHDITFTSDFTGSFNCWGNYNGEDWTGTYQSRGQWTTFVGNGVEYTCYGNFLCEGGKGAKPLDCNVNPEVETCPVQWPSDQKYDYGHGQCKV